MSIQRGGDSGFLVYLLPNTTSTTPPVPLPILLNPNSTYSGLHALGTYCRWQKATTSWQELLCTGGPEVIMTRVGWHCNEGPVIRLIGDQGVCLYLGRGTPVPLSPPLRAERQNAA